MTFAWASENWNRDREERQLEDLKHSSITETSRRSSLKDWLDARARQVTALPREITPSQRPKVETSTGENTSELRDLKEWLSSRARNAGIICGNAVNLKSAFSRPTFVPDPPTLAFTPRSASQSIHVVESPAQKAVNLSLSANSKAKERNKTPLRITSGQVFLALSRLVLEINWDFFHQNRILFNMSDITPERSEQWWHHICQVYDQYCQEAAQGVEALMELYKHVKAGDQVLDIEQTVLSPMMRFLVGYKPGCEGEERSKKALEALLTEGGFLVYVTEWCLENGLTYPGGTGRTKERLKEYSLASSTNSEEVC
ncbi:hypothetical protein BKA65DRAFT_566663 [Rhexocercosporidium sp. MPI-PUGE-AT-0058]|nr:hypothetical protein BKA65DRAFT_566663 [Rhexocercosporidium sp. MPI-PUGE-AT-0058]